MITLPIILLKITVWLFGVLGGILTTIAIFKTEESKKIKARADNIPNHSESFKKCKSNFVNDCFEPERIVTEIPPDFHTSIKTITNEEMQEFLRKMNAPLYHVPTPEETQRAFENTTKIPGKTSPRTPQVGDWGLYFDNLEREIKRIKNGILDIRKLQHIIDSTEKCYIVSDGMSWRYFHPLDLNAPLQPQIDKFVKLYSDTDT